MTHYVIRVEGALSTGFVSAFPALESSQHVPTLVHGYLEDQSALSGVLAQLRTLGVDVIEVRRTPHPSSSASTPDEPADAEAT